MELRLVIRGALAGALAGVLGFIFARIFAEPVINKAIDYESGRDDWINKLSQAAGQATTPDGPEIFSRHIQSTIGIATGIIAFSVAMGALVAVVYLVLHGRVGLRPRQIVWIIAALGFLGVFGLPFAKYPANPPAIGHDFTIVTRGRYYLLMVGVSIVLLIGAVVLCRRLLTRGMSPVLAVVISAVAVLALWGVVAGLLPSLGNLQANKDAANQFGFGRSATETPQPITNVLDHALTVDGKQIAPGQIVYPGFDADVLWRFRWYSLLNQMLIWTTIGLTFGALTEKVVGNQRPAWAQHDRRTTGGREQELEPVARTHTADEAPARTDVRSGQAR